VLDWGGGMSVGCFSSLGVCWRS